MYSSREEPAKGPWQLRCSYWRYFGEMELCGNEKWLAAFPLSEAELDQLRTARAQSVRMSLEAIIDQMPARLEKLGARFENGETRLPGNQQSPICTPLHQKIRFVVLLLVAARERESKRKRLDRVSRS